MGRCSLHIEQARCIWSELPRGVGRLAPYRERGKTYGKGGALYPSAAALYRTCPARGRASLAPSHSSAGPWGARLARPRPASAPRPTGDPEHRGGCRSSLPRAVPAVILQPRTMSRKRLRAAGRAAIPHGGGAGMFTSMELDADLFQPGMGVEREKDQAGRHGGGAAGLRGAPRPERGQGAARAPAVGRGSGVDAAGARCRSSLIPRSGSTTSPAPRARRRTRSTA